MKRADSNDQDSALAGSLWRRGRAGAWIGFAGGLLGGVGYWSSTFFAASQARGGDVVNPLGLFGPLLPGLAALTMSLVPALLGSLLGFAIAIVCGPALERSLGRRNKRAEASRRARALQPKLPIESAPAVSLARLFRFSASILLIAVLAAVVHCQRIEMAERAAVGAIERDLNRHSTGRRHRIPSSGASDSADS